MAGHSAFADVGETLVEVLADRLGHLLDRGDVVLRSPAVSGGQNPPRLTLFLYKVVPSGHLRNERPTSTDPNRFRGTPLVVDLYYLLTAHSVSADNAGTGVGGQHTALGSAMQAFHDDAIVEGSDLRGSLAGGEELHVTPVTMDQEVMDEILTVWSTFPNEAYQPSMVYVVGPVRVDSTREGSRQRVVEGRTRQFLAGPEDEENER